MPHPRPRLRIRKLPPRPPIRQRPSTPHPPPATWLRRALRSVRTWYQRADWSKHTAVIAAAVAALGLGVTAWGTLMSARVAEDQLKESKEQRTERSKEQAGRVTFWQEPEVTVVANRSLDPADVYLKISSVGGSHAVSDVKYLGTIPPCIRLSLPAKKLLEVLSDEKSAPDLSSVYVSMIYLSDTYGKKWQRSSYGQLEPGWDEATVQVERMNALLTQALGYRGVLLSDPSVKSEALDSCGPGN